MERSQESRKGSSTITSSVAKYNTLNLKRQAESLQQEMESDIKENYEKLKKDLSGKSSEELESFVDKIFDDAQGKVMEKFREMKAEVKSHAPKPPENETGESDEQFKARLEAYKKDKENYEEYVSTATVVIRSIVKIFTTVLEKIKEFFINLWNWIVKAISNIAEKVSSFVGWVKATISCGLFRLFG